MAQGYTDFSEQSLGTDIVGWTSRLDALEPGDVSVVTGPAGSIGGQSIYFNPAVIVHLGMQGMSYDAIDAHADREDFELLVRFLMPTHINSNHGLYLIGRVSGTARANSTYVGAGNLKVEGQRLQHRINGSLSWRSSDVAGLGWPDAIWSWMRVRVIAGDVLGKWWNEPDTEPAGWGGVGTTTISQLGWAGVHLSAWGSGSSKQAYIDVFSYGTGGDVAPSEAVIATPTLTLPNVTGITATSVTPNVTVTF